MESDEVVKAGVPGTSKDDIDSQCAVNSLILDYYKKFGRKRDLEQFFSLSTAESDIRDTSGLFWRKMKSENDSSDSGGRRSDSSAHELCRISIRCSMPDPSSSQSDDPKTKTESPQTESPPIIIEEAPADISRQTDDESFRSDDNHSQKSFDPLLDLSAHKPVSPTSSITSQRKLEWDSLADVGYGNESDRKASGSSLSTLERLALKQQYSNNDSKQDIGTPTCHSTPLDDSEGKSKSKKSAGRKMTKIVKKDVDFVEVNVPHTSDSNQPHSINVNLTKHISFNVEKDGGITFDNIRKDINVSPEKVTVEPEVPYLPVDKEIQTSLQKIKDKSIRLPDDSKHIDINTQKIPVMINLNTLRKRLRRKKIKVVRRRVRSKVKRNERKEIPPQEKSGEQLSEAESFEYMPGHMYNQNQMNANEVEVFRPDHNSTAGNKSSLESSGGITTDSSNGSKHSLTQDLEKCIQVLKVTLQKRYDDSETKKKFIKEIVQRLLNSRYRDDETTTDFLSGLSFSSKVLNTGNNTTTSTSDANNSDVKQKRPKKSILRMDKFDSNIVASSSQSAPNLFTATSSEKLDTKLPKTSNTESDESSKGRTSSDNALPKTSSEELYLKYMEALKREESYKRHLKDKEMFLKQKLGNSDIACNVQIRQEAKINNRLKDLMKDLVRNNYVDGSGDASKLEGGSLPERNSDRIDVPGRCQRSHSVFTLSSSPESHKKVNMKKKRLVDRDLDSNSRKNHYCCCPHHSITSKVGYVDSSVQVNIKCEYEHETNETSNQAQPGKYLNCLGCQNTICFNTDPGKTNGEVRAICRECQDKKKCGQQIGSVCPKCDKYTDIEVIHTCPKCNHSPRNITKMVPDKNTGDIKYVCVCKEKSVSSSHTGDILIYKCCKLTNRGIQFEDPNNEINTAAQCGSCKSSEKSGIRMIKAPSEYDPSSSGKTSNYRNSQYSQTYSLIKILENSETEPNTIGASTYTCKKSFLNSENAIKTVMINEAIRAVQTEISFDPKIDDPTWSDIVIINNCAELINEQVREKVLSSDSLEDQKSYSNVCTNSEMGKFLLSPVDSLYEGNIKDSYVIKPVGLFEGNIKDSCVIKPPAPKVEAPSDYNIPIHGTNMTLRVTLASNEFKNSNKQVTQCCETTKIPIADQGTCISTECGKSAQCQSSTKSTWSSVEPSSNKSSMSGRASSKKSCLSKPSTSKSPVRSTYPKTVQLKDKNPFRRSNTDTGKIEMYCSHVESNAFKKAYPGSPRKQPETKPPDSCCQGREKISQENEVIPQSPKRHKPLPKPATTESCSQARDTDTKTPQKTPPLSPKKKPKMPVTSDFYCQTGDADVNRMMPQQNQTPLEPPKEQNETQPTMSESCCQTKDTNLNNIIFQQNKKCHESHSKKSDKPPMLENCMQTRDIGHKTKAQNKSLKSPKKQCESKASTVETCSQTSMPVEKLELSVGSRSSGETSTDKQEIGIQKDLSEDEKVNKKSTSEIKSKSVATQRFTPRPGDTVGCQTEDTGNDSDMTQKDKSSNKDSNGNCGNVDAPKSSKISIQDSPLKKKACDNCGSQYPCQCDTDDCKGFTDPIMNMIQTITRRYSKNDIMKIKKKKCFTEIVGVLNYLLETEESTDHEPKSAYNTPDSSDHCGKKSESPSCCDKNSKKYIRLPVKSPSRNKNPVALFEKSPKSPNRSDNNIKKKPKQSCDSKKALKHTESESLPSKHDKSIQQTSKSTSKCTESSELPCSTDLPSTSDSTACKILNKIRKECEKYHVRRSKCGRKCEVSSSTSFNCDNCKKTHHCGCRHKCKRPKTVDKFQKKCVAYNLILQTSESMLSEETTCEQSRHIQNIVVKVPKRKDKVCTETCKETIYKIEKGVRNCSPSGQRSRSCPKESEMSSTDDYVRRTQHCTVREYLEMNRPDFVEKCSERQSCLKLINKMRANERAAQRDLLSLHLDREPDLTTLSTDQLRQLAQQIGLDIRQKRTAPKFISEREMKKHSQKIYKTLPEVVQKKEEKKKENIKKTNLLMANIFKKNLQKKTLKGSVNLSNYSTVIKM